MSSLFSTLQSSTPSSPSPLPPQDYAATLTTKLVQLLKSIDYPYEINEDSIHSTISNLFKSNNGTSSTKPTATFLEWLINNVTAETNWPGYPECKKDLLQPINSLSNTSISNDMDDGQLDNILQNLDHEHQQLQNTLMSLEMELSDLKALEIQSSDANRLLDMEIHDTSVQFDAIALKLSETAHSVLSEYLAPINVDMDHGKGNGPTSIETDQEQSSPKWFIYQCQEELQQIQNLDITYLDEMGSLIQQIVNLIALPRTSTSPAGQSHAITHLDRILKRDPSQERELVRLCSTYRATKMNHIRVVAQLKCLEGELQYMKDLEMKYEDTNTGNEDTTADFKMYTIASSRNQQIQKTRQQEIELISTQRETARLKDEMEQLLSYPENDRRQSASSTFSDNGASGGVLVDICEQISRNDIELRFLSTAHSEYISNQENALKELDSIVNRLLEYFCLGVVIEQTLELEKNAIQNQKDTLWAITEELREHNEQSAQLHRSSKLLDVDMDINKNIERQDERANRMSQSKNPNELLEVFKQSTDILAEAQKERQILQENLSQMLNGRDILERVLYRHSSTNQVQFAPRELQLAKDDLTNRTRQLQQNYSLFNDHLNTSQRM
ncbi:hypothetical protein BGZ76_003062 [Entomortierella beljakovae]|nr:hypothetical protein BGZ76_003062 [Entomortierella beljakovae]